MGKILTFGDVEVGDEIDTLVKNITTRRLAQWASLTREFSERHFDRDYARDKEGLPSVIAHGAYLTAFLDQMMTDWIGEKGILKRLIASFRHAHLAHEACICKGRVARKYTEGNQNCIECEIWIENPDGNRTVRGSAIAVLPE